MESALIEFQDSPVGRQAYVQGSTLAVWEVVLVALHYDLDAAAAAEHMGWTLPRVRTALSYAVAHPDEMALAIEDIDAMDMTALARLVPATTSFEVRIDGTGASSDTAPTQAE